MSMETAAPDPVAATAMVWIGLLLVSLVINFTAIIVALHVWGARPERSEGQSLRGYALVLVAAGFLILGSVLEVAGIFRLRTSALEAFAKAATSALLPIAFGVFAYAVYRRRPSAPGRSG